MSCIQGITANIINDCGVNSPIGGVEEILYAFNAEDVTFTYSLTNSSLITDIAVATGKQGYNIEGYKKTTNIKTTLVVSDILPEMYTHDVELTIWGIDATTVKQLKELNKIVLVVERKNKGVAGNGAFVVLGVNGSGLIKSSLTSDANADSGVWKLSLTATEQEAPQYIFYDTNYATSKATLDGLLSVQS